MTGNGGLRVAGSRVWFESVWHLHTQGASPKEIVEGFDTLEVADVCAVLAWALRHPKDVTHYLKSRDQEAARVKRELEDGGFHNPYPAPLQRWA